MKYLAGTAQASVAVLYPVCRWLSDRDRVAYNVMDAALRPAHLVSGEDDALLAVLKVGRDIGLFDRLGSARINDQAADWALREPVRSQRDDWYADPLRFRVLVRRALLAKAVDDIAADATPSDVAVGLAWLLAQDPAWPLSYAYGSGPERALNDQKLDSYITGPTQWRVFVRWAVSLGCAELTQGRNRRLVLPDPTAALTEELPPIPPAGLEAKTFYDAVSRELPVLDGGRIAEFMRMERAECADPRGDALVGPAFSLALRRLRGQRILDLRDESDTADRVNGVLHGQRWTFDRVLRTGGNDDD